MSSDTLLMKLSGEGATGALEMRRARISEGMSQITAISLEVLSRDRGLALADFLGRKLRLEVVPRHEGEATRFFGGICVSAEYLGTVHNYGCYHLEIRSGLWVLGRRRDNRVFQGMTTPEIIQKVLGDHALSGNLKLRLDQSYAARDYCLQFGESDFDFLSRLMEEEGISYYFTCTAAGEQIVLSDGVSGHDPLPGDPLEYLEPGTRGAGSKAQLTDLQDRKSVV